MLTQRIQNIKYKLWFVKQWYDHTDQCTHINSLTDVLCKLHCKVYIVYIVHVNKLKQSIDDSVLWQCSIY